MNIERFLNKAKHNAAEAKKVVRDKYTRTTTKIRNTYVKARIFTSFIVAELSDLTTGPGGLSDLTSGAVKFVQVNAAKMVKSGPKKKSEGQRKASGAEDEMSLSQEDLMRARQAREEVPVHVPEVPPSFEKNDQLDVTKRSTILDEDDELHYDDAALTKNDLYQSQPNEGKGATVDRGEWVYITRPKRD